MQPQLEIDRLDLERRDGAQAGDPFIQAAQRLFLTGPAQAGERTGALTVHVWKRELIQGVGEVGSGGSILSHAHARAAAYDQRVSVPGMRGQKLRGCL